MVKSMAVREQSALPIKVLILTSDGRQGSIDASSGVNISEITNGLTASSFEFYGANLPNNTTDIEVDGNGANYSLLQQGDVYLGNITYAKVTDPNLVLIIEVG